MKPGAASFFEIIEFAGVENLRDSFFKFREITFSHSQECENVGNECPLLWEIKIKFMWIG